MKKFSTVIQLLFTCFCALGLLLVLGSMSPVQAQPDLVALRGKALGKPTWTSPYPPIAGKPTVLAIKVKNVGGGFKGRFLTTLFVDNKPVKTWSFPSEARIKDMGSKAFFLPPGGSRTFDYQITMRKPGKHTVRVVVDAKNQVRELKKQNNVLVFSETWISPQAMADLVVVDISHEGVLELGKPQAWKVRIKNRGKVKAAGPFFVNLKNTEGKQIGFTKVESLAPGKSLELTFKTPGVEKKLREPEKVTATVDMSNLVAEVDENNNFKTKHFQYAIIVKPTTIAQTTSSAVKAIMSVTPKIKHIDPAMPGRWTRIQGINFSPGIQVFWEQATATPKFHVLNGQTIQVQVPEGFPRGSYRVFVKKGALRSNIYYAVVDGWKAALFPNEIKKPYNLCWLELDPNGAPLNPRWSWQLTHSYGAPDYYPPEFNTLLDYYMETYYPKGQEGIPEVEQSRRIWKIGPTDLSDQYATENWGNVLVVGCGPHRNFTTGFATYEGFLIFDHYSQWNTPFEDDDLNFYLFTPRGAGAVATSAKKGSFKCEFDKGDTFGRVCKTPWWRAFIKAVDKVEWKNPSHIKSAKDMVNKDNKENTYAIVTGIVNLDGAHDDINELHPTYAMSIRVKDDPNDEHWAMFASNWGHQGCCGDDHIYPPLPVDGNKQVYRVLLPWRPGAKSVNVINKSFFGTRTLPMKIQPIAGKGVMVSYWLPWPGDRAFVQGELHLRWVYPQGKSPQPHWYPKQALVNMSKYHLVKDYSEEEILKKIVLESIPIDRRQAFINEYKNIRKKDIRPQAVKVRVTVAAPVLTDPTPAFKPGRMRIVPNPKKVRQAKQVDEALQRAGVRKLHLPGPVMKLPALQMTPKTQQIKPKTQQIKPKFKDTGPQRIRRKETLKQTN